MITEYASDTTPIRLGFIPLLDAAPLIVARELGLFEEQGLAVQLRRENSWASLRDKLAVGLLDGAQMLSPMVLASNLGLGTPAHRVCTSLVLSRNGNAITVSQALYDQLQATGYDLTQPVQSARALAICAQRSPRPLQLGMVYAWSSHYLQLHDWLASGNLTPGGDVELVTVPPPRMLDALKEGVIDVACVGEPWNSLAECEGLGHILVTGHQIWQNAPEKVFAVSGSWLDQHPDEHHRLLTALIRACQWLDAPENRAQTLDWLAMPEYLGAPLQQLAVSGRPLFHPRIHQHFHRQTANFPWQSQGQWLLSRMVASGQVSESSVQDLNLSGIYRTDLYREAARALGLDAPAIDGKEEGCHEEPFMVDGLGGPVEVAADRLMGRDCQPWE